MNITQLDEPDAAALLRRGGVLAYPTEGVWGLGCDPMNAEAVQRILNIKQRDVAKGLILIAAAPAHLDRYVDLAALPGERRQIVLASWPGPHTWIVPASAQAPKWITGAHSGIAVRVTGHPVASALCQAFGGALVSTSANRAGATAPERYDQLDPALLADIDGVLQGATGGLGGATRIRDACNGTVLRG